MLRAFLSVRTLCVSRRGLRQGVTQYRLQCGSDLLFELCLWKIPGPVFELEI
jgi:hypothetical protein